MQSGTDIPVWSTIKPVSIWDINPGMGGPLKQDRVWFHTSFRYWGNVQDVGGMWYNATINSPKFTPDLSRPATAGDTWLADGNVRLTIQATPKDKLTVYYDNSQRLIARRNTSPTLAPEATDPAQREMLFIRQPNEHLATWEGEKLTKERATSISGIKRVRWLSELPSALHVLMCESEQIGRAHV